MPDQQIRFKIENHQTWGIKYMNKLFNEHIAQGKSPVLLDILCTQTQQLLPSQGLKDGKQMPLHNMVPFLSDEELQQEMVLKL